MNFLLCNQCPNHSVSQDWWKQNFDPKIGRGLLSKAQDSIPNYSATINTIQVGAVRKEAAGTSENFGIDDIEEILCRYQTDFFSIYSGAGSKQLADWKIDRAGGSIIRSFRNEVKMIKHLVYLQEILETDF